MLTIITIVLFIISACISYLDLISVPMCACIDPGTVVSFVVWIVTLGCPILALSSSSKEQPRQKLFIAGAIIASFFVIYTLTGIYFGYQSENEFQEEIQQRFGNKTL